MDSNFDRNLLDSLRRPVDLGGWDGFGPDELHVQAAGRIEQLLAAIGTEQAMHAAWRKRAEEAEAERDEAKAELSDIRENCYYACVSKKTAQADIERVAKDFEEVADHWKAKATEAQELLRKALAACSVTAEAETFAERERARKLAREVIGSYGKQGGMHAN